MQSDVYDMPIKWLQLLWLKIVRLNFANIRHLTICRTIWLNTCASAINDYEGARLILNSLTPKLVGVGILRRYIPVSVFFPDHYC